ncbi:MAG: carbohydrate ABC transporter permease [Anaerolineae bacterium]|nr:carbohydrate ABC transporter permease [Anaerolineae bacterium]
MVAEARAALPRLQNRRLLNLARIGITYCLLGIIVAFCVFPVLWILKTSFETPQYIRNPQIQWVPIQFTLDNYHEVLTNPRAMIGRSLLNSVLVSGTSTLFAVVMTTLAGYAMSRYQFRGKFLFSMYLILINMIPGTLLLVSMFILLIRVRLVNSHWGLIAFYAAGGIPLATWMLKSYFDSIPIELEEQAMIDGASRLQALRRIVLPLALPGIAAVGLFIFMGNWNEFMAALTILQNQELRTLPVQIINFMGFQRVEWGPVMAYSVIVGLPVAFVFMFVQTRIVGGLTAGFTK